MSSTNNANLKNKNRTHIRLMSNITTMLYKLDKDLAPRRSSGAILTAESNNLEDLMTSTSELKTMYKDFVEKFATVGELEDNVFVYSVALAKKVVLKAKKEYNFKKGEFILLYAACLYLSIKMLIDEERWFIEDFSYVSGLEEKHIEKMEKFVLFDILNFNAKISDAEYFAEEAFLKNMRRKKSGAFIINNH